MYQRRERRRPSLGSPALLFVITTKYHREECSLEDPPEGLPLEDDPPVPNKSCVPALPEVPLPAAPEVEAPPEHEPRLEAGVGLAPEPEPGVALPAPDCGGVGLFGIGDRALGVVPRAAPDC